MRIHIISVFAAAIIIFCATQSCVASPVSGTEPGAGKGSAWAVALEYDFTYDRDLKASEISDGELKESNTLYGKLSIRPTDFLTLYGKAGTSAFETDVDVINGRNLKEKYKGGLYAGGGGKFIAGLGSKIKLIFDTQFNWWKSDIEKVTYGGIEATTKGGDMVSWSYQGAAILGYKIDWKEAISPAHGEFPYFTPYAGAKYEYLKMDSDVTASGPGFSITAPDIRKNDDKVGLVVGLDINFQSTNPSGFDFNVEGRFFDETAISGYLNYNF